MRRDRIPSHARPLPDFPASEALEQFCQAVARTYGDLPLFRLTVEAFTREVRRFLQAPVHVPIPWLRQQIEALGISLIDNPAIEGLHGFCQYNMMKQRWEIHINYECKEPAQSILHELCEFIFWRCYYLCSWWKEWMAWHDILHPHQIADEFAFYFLLPPREFRQKTREYGCDILSLANYFGVRPYMVNRALNGLTRLPCPIFIARCGLRDLPSEIQGTFCFDERSIRAIVWSKNRAPAWGPFQPEWEEIEVLRYRFPKRKKCLYLDDFMYQAVMEGRQILKVTQDMVGIHLKKPVMAAARPDGLRRSQIYLQVVPCGYEHVLHDEAIRTQMEEEFKQTSTEKARR